ncbi:MAG: IS1/IS6 family transposase [Chloroflexi bacterium]|nr:IS1/IS6 family transposase [Chloroflexota bacterium]
MDEDTEAESWRRLAMTLGDAIGKGELRLPTCKFCGSDNVARNGLRKGTQYWLCRNCGRGFVDNKAVPKSRYPIDVVARALYNYYAGMSLNAICEGIRQDMNETVTDTSIYNWLAKYTRIALNETENYPPKVSKKWVMDETVVVLDGKKWWLITALDWDTRYLLGMKLSTNRNNRDIREVLEKATAKTGVTPDEVLTDGWGGYREATEQAYGADSKHIVSKPFTDKELSTNLMERWNGTLKDRLKPMRGMDRNTNFQLILDGFVFYYNYLRPHMALGGKTPAQAAGVNYPYKSWGDVVKSQMPKLEVTREDRVEYRVRRKVRAMKQKPKKTARRMGTKIQTMLKGIRP